MKRDGGVEGMRADADETVAVGFVGFVGAACVLHAHSEGGPRRGTTEGRRGRDVKPRDGHLHACRWVGRAVSQ